MKSLLFRICAISGFAVITAVFSFTGAHAAGNKDYILVLDTSYSMAGSGGKNIIEGVKTTLNNYVDKMEKGDSLTFATFSDDVFFYPTVLVEDKNDKDIVRKYLSIVQAKGSWTYTLEMIKKVLAKADELQKINKNRQIVIVVMTDTLDDPPPSKRNQKISIKDIAKTYKGDDWFVYLISINDAMNDKRLRDLAGDLSASIPSTKVINENDPSKSMVSVESDLAKKGRDKFVRTLFAVMGIVLGFIILGILWRFIYAKFFSYKFIGFLDYRYMDSPYKDFDRFDLSKVDDKRVQIGKGALFRLNLRDYTEFKPVVLQAKRVNKQIQPVLLEAISAPVEFQNTKHAPFLHDGDSFKVGGYLIFYREK